MLFYLSACKPRRRFYSGITALLDCAELVRQDMESHAQWFLRTFAALTSEQTSA